MTIYRHRVTGPGSAGDQWTSTMHSQGAGSLATVHAAWQALISGFITATMAALWPNEVGATSVITDQLDANGLHNVGQLSSSISGGGTGTGATLSPRSCVVIGLRTSVPTKAGRGRMYWPAPDGLSQLGTGNLNGTVAAAIATSFSGRLTTFKATSQPVILHRGHDARVVGGIPEPLVPSTWDNITQVTVGVVLGTQKRRTNRVANAYSTGSV